MRHFNTTVISAVGIATLLAGCDSGTPATPPQASSASSASSASGSTVADPNAGLKSGTQLKTVLVGLKALPAHFKVSSAGVRDTADVFGPPTNPSPVSHPNCTQLDGNRWVTVAGQAPAFALTDFVDSFGNEVLPEVDSYRGTDAKAVLTAYRKLFAACKKYKTKASGPLATVSVVIKPGPKVGDESFRAVATSPTYSGGTTYVAVRVGTSVVTVIYSSTSKDLGAKASSLAASMARRL